MEHAILRFDVSDITIPKSGSRVSCEMDLKRVACSLSESLLNMLSAKFGCPGSIKDRDGGDLGL